MASHKRILGVDGHQEGSRDSESWGSHLRPCNLFLLMFIFILRERERERERESEREWGKDREREGERESQAGSIHTVSTDPDAGLELTNREIMT